METRCVQQHISIRNQDLEQVFSKGFTLEIDLGREQEKLIDKDIPKEAKAWTDNSPFRGVETNDVGYARKYLMMPEMIEKLIQLTQENVKVTVGYAKNQEIYNENIKLHLEVQKQQLNTQRELRDGIKELRDLIKEKK